MATRRGTADPNWGYSGEVEGTRRNSLSKRVSRLRRRLNNILGYRGSLDTTQWQGTWCGGDSLLNAGRLWILFGLSWSTHLLSIIRNIRNASLLFADDVALLALACDLQPPPLRWFVAIWLGWDSACLRPLSENCGLHLVGEFLTSAQIKDFKYPGVLFMSYWKVECEMDRQFWCGVSSNVSTVLVHLRSNTNLRSWALTEDEIMDTKWIHESPRGYSWRDPCRLDIALEIGLGAQTFGGGYE